MDIRVGDSVRLKKQHPCGSREWEVLRSGMDFRLKCRGCGHQVMIARRQLEKNVRQILPGEARADGGPDREGEDKEKNGKREDRGGMALL